MKRWIAFVLAVAVVMMFTGCDSKETAWQGTETTSEIAESAFDPTQIDALLQGQWMYYDSVLGSYEVLLFQEGSVTYTSWLDAVPDKVTISEATYTVEEDVVDLHFHKTNYHNKFSYSWAGTELILHKYIDSGADKGNTRIYQKQDTAVPGSVAASENSAPTGASNVLIGEWIAGGLVSEGSIYDFSSNSALADLYDTNWIYTDKDGSFQLQNGIYTYEGTWTEAELEGSDHFYVFNQTESFRFAVKDGELKEIASESIKTYYGAFLDSNCNVLLVYENLEDGASSLIYLRDGKQAHLTAMMNSGNAKPNTEQSKPSANSNSSAGSNPSSGSTATKPSQSATSGQRNALAAAQDYLAFMPFSYTGLIEQLEFEGYTQAEATYAADNCGADWYEQAVRAAENYLDFMAFSRSGLIEQLEFEGYTHDQAVYGVDNAY